MGASASARTEAVRHGWRVLAILSALMGFASISTDLYLPAMPTMGRALRADAGMVEWTISGYLIGFSWTSYSGAQSATVMAARMAMSFCLRSHHQHLGRLWTRCISIKR